jgi:hypothetical protein
MRIKIRGLREPGVLEKERLVLEVPETEDIGRYAIFCNHLTSAGAVSPRVERIFWFPDTQVKAGDLVVLYSKRGANHDRPNKDETTTHFFYWNLDTPVWTGDRIAVVAHLDEWEAVEKTSES